MTADQHERVDAAGVCHAPAGSGARIVSLVPSITELLFDIGLGDAVIGRTAFCVHPRDQVRRARNVGGTKQVNLDRLKQLRPTHVIVNIDETPRPLAEQLMVLGYTVVVTHPIDVLDNLALYRLIGGIFGRQAEADALCARFEAAHTALTEATREQPRRQVLYLIWKDPWMTVARQTYISRMLALIGWLTLPEEATERYPTLSLSDDLLASTDLVLFSSEPFPFKGRHLEAFRAQFPNHARKARLIDGQMISWYGSRAIKGLAYLQALAKESLC